MQLPVEIGALLAGKYRIERVIGQGGMGIVVGATHHELDQRVAIKFLSPEGGAKGSEWVSRFAREARAAAKIRNEHAVKVYDVGKLDTGIPYMVMEYLEGQNLDEILAVRRSLPIDEAADYLLQACEALAEAHLVGIVHRDLKPANLFLTHRSDGTTCVKILDFGISKVDESLIGNAAIITHTTSLVGSPLYMSPERLRGAKDVDRRADIWSLGVLLQEMVTGEPSFPAETIPDIHAMVLTAEPVPLRKSLPSAPPELEALILKCLAKTPEARVQSVLEFATALGAVASGSQNSVERIARITSGSGRKARLSESDASRSGSFPPEPGTGPNVRLAVTAAEPDSDPAPPRFVPPITESLPTVSATGTLGDALKRSTGKMAIAATVLIAAAIVLVTVVTRRHQNVTPASAVATSPAALISAALPMATVTAPESDTVQGDLTTSEESVVIKDEHGAVRLLPRHRATRDGAAKGAESAAASASAMPSGTPATTASASASPSGFVDYGGRN